MPEEKRTSPRVFSGLKMVFWMWGERMSKGFCYNFAVVSALLFGVGIVNNTFVGSAIAEKKKCDKCGDAASKAENNCTREGHTQSTK